MEIKGFIKELLKSRDKLRKKGKFEEADKIRNRIEKLGYTISDTKTQTVVVKKSVIRQKPKNSYIVLFGSGEIASSGRRVHELVFKRIDKVPIEIAIITAPAGFQANVKDVHEEIKQFFQEGLVNFHPKTNIVFANNRHDADNPEVIKPIETADYIFAGPGSPSYAVKNLKDTLLYRKILERVKNGATLALSSAAAIAFSKFCLPVYEIYKVGEPLHWLEGLNFFEEFLEPLTVIPHLNNNEGGEKLDTSYCWMGRERIKRLLAMLSKDEKVVGIDEHTAVVYDLKRRNFSIQGKGSVRVLRRRLRQRLKIIE